MRNLKISRIDVFILKSWWWFAYLFLGYIGEFEIVDDHRNGKIVVNLTGRLNKVSRN